MPMSRFCAGMCTTSLTVDDHPADVGPLEAGEHAQRRGLAAARRTEQRHELTGLDVEREAVERLGRAEAPREVLEHDRRPALRC